MHFGQLHRSCLFEIYYKEIQGTEETFEMNGYRIRAFRVNHNVLCYGYTMEIDRAGKFDVERAKAANIPLCCWNPLQKGNVVEFEGVHYTPDMVLGGSQKGNQTDLHDRYQTDQIHHPECRALRSVCLRRYVWRG